MAHSHHVSRSLRFSPSKLTNSRALVAKGEKVDLEMTLVNAMWRAWFRDLFKRNMLSLVIVFGSLVALIQRLFV